MVRAGHTADNRRSVQTVSQLSVRTPRRFSVPAASAVVRLARVVGEETLQGAADDGFAACLCEDLQGHA